jgi:hypothetical protein
VAETELVDGGRHRKIKKLTFGNMISNVKDTPQPPKPSAADARCRLEPVSAVTFSDKFCRSFMNKSGI